MILLLFLLMFKAFVTGVSLYHPNIKFMCDCDISRISFFNLEISLSERKSTTDLHTEQTDKHQYLEKASVNLSYTELSTGFRQI